MENVDEHTFKGEQDALSKHVLFPPPHFLSMPSAGVDIGDSVIRVIKLERSGNEYAVEYFGEQPLPPGAVSGGEVKDVGKLAKALADLQSKHGFQFAHAALPEERAYLFQTTLHGASGVAETRSMIEFKLEENVPLQPQNAVFDYETVQFHSTSGEKLVNVVAFPSDTIENYTQAFKEAGIFLLSLEMEAHALARAVTPRGAQDSYLIMDVGARGTRIAIVDGGIPQFTATIDIGGNMLVGATSAGLSISSEEAEQILKRHPLSHIERENAAVHAELTEQLSRLQNEVGRYLSYWQSRTAAGGKQPAPVKRIIICGGAANMAELPSFISAESNVPVGRCNVWENILSFEETIPPIDYEHSLSYAVAAGLALKGMERSIL